MITVAEQEFHAVVGGEGYDKAVATWSLIGMIDNDKSRSLYFLTLLNAYWRGKNDGVTEARAIVNQAKAVALGVKSN